MLIFGDRKFIEATFDSESELEQVVVSQFEHLFGPSSLYFPKALIRTRDGFGTIPDGFAIDLAGRRWFIVEAELSAHSVWSHIAPQVAKQIIAAINPASRQLLIDLIVEEVRDVPASMDKFADEDIEPIDIRRLLGEILEKQPVVGMPIDAVSNDLKEWAATLKVGVKLWIVRKLIEFGHPENVLYEIPEEFQPVLDTEDAESEEVTRERSGVTVAELLRHGLLTEGQKLSLNWKPRNGQNWTFEGIVKPNGEIEVNNRTFTSPSYAAVFAFQSAGSTRTTANGWKKWKTEGGETLSELRDKLVLKLRDELAQSLAESNGSQH